MMSSRGFVRYLSSFGNGVQHPSWGFLLVCCSLGLPFTRVLPVFGRVHGFGCNLFVQVLLSPG